MKRSGHRAAAIGVAVCAALVLGGCTSSGSESAPSGSGSPSGSGPTVQSPTVTPTHPQDKIPPDSSIVEVPALRKTIQLTSCKATSDGWEGAGTARNTASSSQTYHLLVFFTDKFSRTIDYARTTVTVAPGKTATWTAARSFTPPKGTQCVLRGLYAGGTSGSPTTSAGKKH